MNALNSLYKTDQGYSLACTNDLIRFRRSLMKAVKVAKASMSMLWHQNPSSVAFLSLQ